MKKYQKPMIRNIMYDVHGHIMAGSVRNDGKTIMDGSTVYKENEVGNGDDAAAKPNFTFNGWDD